MVDDRALTSLQNDQNFTLHCNAMKAIKSLNDQDVLVYDVEDKNDNVSTYYIDEHPTTVDSQDHNNKSNCE